MTAFAAVALVAVLLPLPVARVRGRRRHRLAVVSYVRTPMAERVDFDRVADALVETGWEPGDPILVVGSMADFRSPLEWYLPGDVTLAEAEPAGACAKLWVVTDVPSAGRSSTCRGRNPRGCRTAEVARVNWSGTLAAEAEAAAGHYDSADGGGCGEVEDRVT